MLLVAAGSAALATLVPALRAAGFDPLDLADARLSPIALVAASLGCALAGVGFRSLRPGLDLQRGLASVALAAVALLTFGQQASDQRRSRRHQAHLAQRLEEHLPAGAPLHVALWEEFNLLFLLERELVHVEDPLATPAGGFVLLRAQRARALLEDAPSAFRSVLVLEGPRSGPLALLRAGPDPR